MIKRLSDYMADIRGELKLVSKHASMVTTQVEQVLKAQKEVLDEMNSKKNDYAVRVATRTGRMTQEPLYPEGRPKRIEQDSQRNNIDMPSSSKRKKKKNDRTVQTSSEPIAEPPNNPNDISMSDAETKSGDEHEPSDNVNDNVHVDAQPSNDDDAEIEPVVDLDNPQSKINFMIRETFLLGSTVKKENHGLRNPCLFLLSHPRKRMVKILSALQK